jgi:hypothetical protein
MSARVSDNQADAVAGDLTTGRTRRMGPQYMEAFFLCAIKKNLQKLPTIETTNE